MIDQNTKNSCQNGQYQPENGKILPQKSNSALVTSGSYPPTPKYITKKAEYRLLLHLIRKHKLAIGKGRGYNINAIISALNVNPKTARRWLETPKVQQAIAEELEFYLKKMQETGANDWRQWEKQVELAQKIRQEQTEGVTRLDRFNITIVRTKDELSISTPD